MNAVLEFMAYIFFVIFPGIFSSLSHAGFLFGSHMFDVFAGTLAVLCRKYLCLGAVCVAYR